MIVTFPWVSERGTLIGSAAWVALDRPLSKVGQVCDRIGRTRDAGCRSIASRPTRICGIDGQSAIAQTTVEV